MRRTIRNLTALFAAIALVSAVGAPGSAKAQAAKQYRKQIEHFSEQLDKLAEADEWGVSEEDRRAARKELKSARELLAQGSIEKTKWKVKRVDTRLDLIREMIKTRRIQATAEEQEKTYEKLKEEKLPNLKSEISKQKKRKKELEQKLNRLK